MSPEDREILRKSVTQEFDAIGVRKAFAKVLTSLYRAHPYWTIAQYTVMLEVLVAQDSGKPHTITSLAEQIGMPYTTASRVVYSLTEAGGEDVLKYEAHPGDRRKKFVVLNLDRYDDSRGRVLSQAMVDYYGDSVRALRKRDGAALERARD
jgi:DNA-binding MarR family transcriptional regulator